MLNVEIKALSSDTLTQMEDELWEEFLMITIFFPIDGQLRVLKIARHFPRET